MKTFIHLKQHIPIFLTLLALSACELNIIQPGGSMVPKPSENSPVSDPDVKIGEFEAATVCSDSGSNNLVKNPGFETPEAGSLHVSPQSIFGEWTLVSGSVDVVGGYWQAATGKQSLDLNGESAGSIEQSINITAGKAHRLSLCIAGNPDGGDAVKKVEVLWNQRSLGVLNFDITGKDLQNMGWKGFSIVLPGALVESVNQLRLRSLNTDSHGPAIDNVNVWPIETP